MNGLHAVILWHAGLAQGQFVTRQAQLGHSSRYYMQICSPWPQVSSPKNWATTWSSIFVCCRPQKVWKEVMTLQ